MVNAVSKSFPEIGLDKNKFPIQSRNEGARIGDEGGIVGAEGKGWVGWNEVYRATK